MPREDFGAGGDRGPRYSRSLLAESLAQRRADRERDVAELQRLVRAGALDSPPWRRS